MSAMGTLKQNNLSILCGTKTPLTKPTLIHKYFETSLNKSTSSIKTGLRYKNRLMSYTELNQRANGIARGLRRYLSKNRANDFSRYDEITVAIDFKPSEKLIVAIMAVLKLGAAYLPVDSTSAIDRVKYILNDAEPVCILVDSSSAFIKDTNTLWSQFIIIDFEELVNEQCTCSLSLMGDLNDAETIGHCTTLCIIYTSGSTGKPKGVRLNHTSAMNRFLWQWTEFPFKANEVCCFKTSLLFIDSVVEIFSSVLCLVPLVIVPEGISANPEALVEILETHNVSRLVMVPSLLRNILFYLSVCGGATRLSNLSLWMSNSEILKPYILNLFFDIFPSEKVFLNLYGSTETMADVTYEIFTKDDVTLKCVDNILSIGQPMCNCNVYITDEDSNLLPVGEIGEICISGLSVSCGYVEDTYSDCFTSNMFSNIAEHDILYRTGDFGRIASGGLIYEGRRDTQIKIRGQRVNITEIEKVVHDCSGVENVVVMCHTFSEISSVIVAYYTSNENKSQIESRIFTECKKSLPLYMRPKLFHLDEIPLQPHTMKIDRISLRRFYEKSFRRQSSEELAIMNEKEKKALHIIALNLNLPTNAICKKKSFFELGGNSVAMISTLVQLREHGLHIPIEVFSSAKSVREIISRVEETNGPIGEILQTDKYLVKSLAEVDNSQQIIQIFTESFIEKEPLCVLLGITKAEFIPFAESVYKEAIKQNLSVIVIDKETQKIVGGDFLFDYFKGVKVDHHKSMAPILSLLEYFEGPVKEQLLRDNAGDKLIFNFCLCVHKDLPPAEQAKICHVIEGSVLKVAQTGNFVGVVTNNTNPVTQDICEHFYSYQLLTKYLVRNYKFNGRLVFAHAPDDYYIKMMIKYK